MSIEETRCPLCGGPMVSRTSARGRFWGCREFPRCRGTRDVDGNATRGSRPARDEDDDDARLPSERMRDRDRRRW